MTPVPDLWSHLSFLVPGIEPGFFYTLGGRSTTKRYPTRLCLFKFLIFKIKNGVFECVRVRVRALE